MRSLCRLAAVLTIATGVAAGARLMFWLGNAMALPAQTKLVRPRILSLKYGRFRPTGAPHSYFALKLRVRVTGGQVVEAEFHDRPSGFNAVGDSECGLGGRTNGGVETSYMPVMPKFADGVHHVRVSVSASSCKHQAVMRQASRTFVLLVR